MPNIGDRLTAELPPLATSFFAIFARFECALKRAGYFQENRKLEVNWDAFANKLGQNFFHQICNSGNAKVLFDAPPKRQVVREGNLSWEDVATAANVQEMFGAVCRVRNNLFHGGKFQQEAIEGTSRDQELLEGAKFVLLEALSKDDEVRSFFEEPLV